MKTANNANTRTAKRRHDGLKPTATTITPKLETGRDRCAASAPAYSTHQWVSKRIEPGRREGLRRSPMSCAEPNPCFAVAYRNVSQAGSRSLQIAKCMFAQWLFPRSAVGWKHASHVQRPTLRQGLSLRSLTLLQMATGRCFRREQNAAARLDAG